MNKMDSRRQSVAMERLVTELASLLKMLDHETVSPATADKMASIRHILDTLQLSVNGSEVYVNSCLYGNGTSFVESLFEDFDCDLHMLSASPVEQKDEEEEKTLPNKSTPTDTPPPVPTTPLPDDYYEEAVPLDPGSAPQYFTANINTSRNSVEDAYYEDAENNYPTTRMNGPPKNSYNDSDALSSSYESYEEEEEEAKGQDPPQRWMAEESPDGAVRDCRICAFLLRKKRFGQWAKQLVVVRDNKLQCFKSIKESSPQTELPLNLCNVIYVTKDGRKKRHELRFSLPGGEALVLAVQSQEQAQRWLKVVQEVGSQCSHTDGLDGSTSPIIQRKLELDKVLQAERPASDSDSGPTGDALTQGPGGDGTDSLCRSKRGAFSELTGSMSRAAGKKISRIITFSKRKNPSLGESPASSGRHDNPGCGHLSVLLSGSWKERWCVLRAGSLHLQKEPGDLRPPLAVLPLKGAEVVPGGLGPRHPFSFRILHGGVELAALETKCSESLGRWLGILFAETGSSTLPEELHYDYIDVDTLTDIRHAARHSFLWATGGAAAASSSSTSTDSRTYDEVYESVAEGDVASGQLRRHASFSSRDSEKTEQQAAVKRHTSSVNQYGRYGKTRAEEDAKRYGAEKEELEQQKEKLRSSLLCLRRERKELKEKMKADAGAAVQQRLAQLEALCRQKEEERVELELRLTEVKENLKKSLARGALGPASDAKISVKAQGSKVEKVYNESVPVNSALELRKRPPSLCASTKVNVMQKAKEWESKKAG
ncbi:actin filament-associated protein 1-like 1 isoform X2 [Synchiropus splendidus]|uniref:actin filament-associated protein 1-like 1 isoform X2 n=1 Tax=Synchiropus splendidus TaxID=270530 RepID=UPI00237DCD82|nr:actin filament-associated protein 1-like 1 isoform X2 [Synchiropus splendidus]